MHKNIALTKKIIVMCGIGFVVNTIILSGVLWGRHLPLGHSFRFWFERMARGDLEIVGDQGASVVFSFILANWACFAGAGVFYYRWLKKESRAMS